MKPPASEPEEFIRLDVNTHRGKALRSGAVERRLQRHRPHVVHLYECGGDNSRKRVENIAKRCGYNAYFGDKPGSASTPVLVRSNVRHEFVGAFEISEPGRWVGKKGAGPNRAKGKYCMIVRVWLSDGSIWKSGGFHFTPSIRFKKRLEVVKSQAEEVRQAMRHKVSGPGVRVAGGDANAPWRIKAGRAVLRILRSAGLTIIKTGPTHDSDRRLDYQLFGRAAKLVRRKLLGMKGTDHKGFLGVFVLK